MSRYVHYSAYTTIQSLHANIAGATLLCIGIIIRHIQYNNNIILYYALLSDIPVACGDGINHHVKYIIIIYIVRYRFILFMCRLYLVAWNRHRRLQYIFEQVVGSTLFCQNTLRYLSVSNSVIGLFRINATTNVYTRDIIWYTQTVIIILYYIRPIEQINDGTSSLPLSQRI